MKKHIYKCTVLLLCVTLAAFMSSCAPSNLAAQSAPTSAAGEPSGLPVPSQTQSPNKVVEIAKNSILFSIVGVDDKVNILPEQAVLIEKNDTAFDTLLRTTKQKGIQMEFSGTKSMPYVKGIGNLYGLDKGKNSGWMFTVNGKPSDKGAGEYVLLEGDVVVWKYTKDFEAELSK